jgi:FRG domain
MSGTQETLYKEIRIESWNHLVEEISGGYLNWAFRGHSDASWQLESTLARRFKTAKIDPRAWHEQEGRILRIFQRKAHLFLDHIPPDKDSLRWLALMQHHGAPTRLLDFTWSPYVAAFFALEWATTDAAIWAINPPALRRPISLIVDGEKKEVRPFEIRLRREPIEDGETYYRRYFLKNEHSFVVLDEPHIMNQRIIAQSGTFVIPSTLAKPVNEIVNEYPNPTDVLVKFVLSTRDIRERAMLELYTMNITHYTLFPGIDGLARSMGYESEYNQFFNTRTMEPNPGFESEDQRVFDWQTRFSNTGPA